MIFDEPIPHTEAADLIRSKDVVTREVFASLEPDLKARAFTITGIDDVDLLQSIRDRIAEVPEGGDWHKIRASIAADLEAEWGDEGAARRRAELLLRQHANQAYQATNWRTMKRNTAAFPFWQYLAFGDERVRAAHEALDGMVLPHDDPFWLDHYPPWEWGCRCRVRAITPEERDRLIAADEKRDPAERRVPSDAQIERMRETGKLTRANGTVDVRSPRAKLEAKGEDSSKAFGWTPGDLGLPMEKIELMWDEDLRKAFWDSADAEPYEGGGSVGEWLRGIRNTAVPDDGSKPPIRGLDQARADVIWDTIAGERAKGRPVQLSDVRTVNDPESGWAMRFVPPSRLQVNPPALARIVPGKTRNVAEFATAQRAIAKQKDPHIAVEHIRIADMAEALGVDEMPFNVGYRAATIDEAVRLTTLHEMAHHYISLRKPDGLPRVQPDVRLSLRALIDPDEQAAEAFALWSMGKDVPEALAAFWKDLLGES